jgi:hypothetical protein
MDALNTAPAVTMAAQSRKANGRGRATPNGHSSMTGS